MPAWLTACRDDDPKPEIDYKGSVGVIGAGAAGLFAADYLLSKGINVVIFEASDRIGGRVRSLRPFEKPSPGLIVTSESRLSSDFPIELGAERILGTDSIWAKYVAQQRVTTVPIAGIENDQYFLNGLLTTHTQALSDNDFVAALDFAEKIALYNNANVSVQEAAQADGIDASMNDILNSWIGNKYSTDNNRLSALGLADGLQERVRNTNELVLGNNPMTDVLLASFTKAVAKTQLSTVIKNVNYGSDKVTVSGEASGQPFSMDLDKVIVTVPVSVLKDGDITFTPALPSAKTNALAKMGMDKAIRVVLDFKKNFWRKAETDPDLRFLYGGTQASEYFNTGAGRSEVTKTLTATISGQKAEELSALGKDIVPVLLDELDTIYEGLAGLNIRLDPNDASIFISVIQDWGKEPFIKGGNAYLKPGGTNADREALGTPLNNRLFFAGEATDVKGEFGTVNGALQSAERAALEVIAAITA